MKFGGFSDASGIEIPEAICIGISSTFGVHHTVHTFDRILRLMPMH
jgi:hypothetical protein